MTVYKAKNGKYYCRFKIHGVQKHKLCQGATTKAEALAIEDAEKYKLRQEQAGLIKEEKPVPLKLLCNLYKNHNADNNRQREPKEKIQAVYDYWGADKNARTLQRSDIEGWRRWLKETKNISNATINRYVSFLSVGFNLAIDDNLLEKNPCRRLEGLEEPKETVKFYTKKEKDKIIAVLDLEEFERYKNFVLAVFYTGLRIANIQYMRWEWFDFKNNIINIMPQDNKGKKVIEHPISKSLLKILQKMGIKKEGYVFTNSETGLPYTYPTRFLKKICQKAGVKYIGFHGIRHTVATKLAEDNTPPHVMKAFLAHSDIRTTMKYIHITKNALAKATETLEDFMN